jgi:hypothetical protein
VTAVATHSPLRVGEGGWMRQASRIHAATAEAGHGAYRVPRLRQAEGGHHKAVIAASPARLL